jgi:hypothetical protein
MHKFAQDLGQRIEKSILYNQYQDGVIKQAIRLIIKRARIAIIDQEIPVFFWPKIILAIVYITNRTTTSILQDMIL